MTPRPELRAATVQGLRWSVVARPLVEIVLLGSMVVLARLIPPAEFGRYAVALVFAELAVLIPAEGVGTALVQRADVRREHLQAGLAIALLAAAGFAALTLVLAATLVTSIFGAETADLVRLSIPGFLVAAAGAVPIARLRRRLAFRRLSIIDISTTTTRGIACVGLALAGLDGEALVLGGTLAGAVALTIGWASAPAPPPRLRRGAARELLSYGLPASLASMSWVGFRNCDYAIVAARLGAVHAGYYFRAYTLAVEYQKKVSLVMGQIGFPVLARAGDSGEQRDMRSQMVRLLTILLFPLLALLAITAPELVPWLFGEAWAPAVVPTQVLAVGGAATLVIDTAGVALMAAGRPRALLGYGWAHFLAYAGAVFAVAPLGLTAVAAAAAVVHTLFLFVAYWLMLRGTEQSPLGRLWHDVGPATVSALVLAAAAVPAGLGLAAAGAPVLVHLLGVGVAGGVIYAAALRVLFPRASESVLRLAGEVSPHRRLRGALGRRRRAPLPAAVGEAGSPT